MFTMTAVSNRLRKGSLSRRNTSTPGFSRPIAFSMPDGVSQMRGGGLPWIGFRDIPFTITPPSRFRSTNSANSSPYPNVPDAVSTGFLSRIPAKSMERSGLLNSEFEIRNSGFFLFGLFRIDFIIPQSEFRIPHYDLIVTRIVSLQSISLASNTGPSLQTRLYPPAFTATEQPMQAPTPQAMRSSMETKQGTSCSAAILLTEASMARGPQA